jgi:hypothetical protein
MIKVQLYFKCAKDRDVGQKDQHRMICSKLRQHNVPNLDIVSLCVSFQLSRCTPWWLQMYFHACITSFHIFLTHCEMKFSPPGQYLCTAHTPHMLALTLPPSNISDRRGSSGRAVRSQQHTASPHMLAILSPCRGIRDTCPRLHIQLQKDMSVGCGSCEGCVPIPTQ